MLVDAVTNDWRRANLNEREQAMLAFAEQLTRAPADCGPANIEKLRGVGMADDEILALVMLAGFFNLATRVAEGLGVELDRQFVRGSSEYEALFSRERP